MPSGIAPVDARLWITACSQTAPTLLLPAHKLDDDAQQMPARAMRSVLRRAGCTGGAWPRLPDWHRARGPRAVDIARRAADADC
eukprot:362713-Chlamydomonas_euryale.AAC.10